jgi:ABC-type Fe3+/spermidine/putrescine transport system ATPase subunit
MRFEIREIQKRIGITTVFVTHDQNEAMAAADRLVVMSKGRVQQVGTAREIYEAPSDLFVAEFIGQANLLKGRVAAISGSEARLATGQGEFVARHHGRVAAGQSAALALRPEDLHIAAGMQPGMNNVAGAVSRVNYLGSVTNVGVRAGEQSLVITMARGERLVAEGDNVVVFWPPSAGVLLPEAP